MPLFIHDCEECMYLGEFNNCDLYYADHGGLPDTVIARYGSDGPEYVSGMIFANKGLIPELVEAKKRAVEQGLILSSE